jgi:hypothetical protein
MKRLRDSVSMLRIAFFDGAAQCLFERVFRLGNSTEPFAGIGFVQRCPILPNPFKIIGHEML